MVTALLVVALIVTHVSYIVLLDRRDKRDQHDRQILLNRIQAPATAVAQTLGYPDAEPVRALPYDDDDAYWEYKQGDGS